MTAQQPHRAAWPAVLGAGFLAAFFAMTHHTEDGGKFRAEVYLDGRGIPTACGGLTSAATRPIGVEIRLGQTYTREQCQELGYQIAQRFSDTIRPHVRVPVAARELFAYMHFAWNIGPDAFIRSTLLRKLNAGDYRGACDQILVWMRSGGADCRTRASGCYGIFLRRVMEHAICVGEWQPLPGMPAIPLTFGGGDGE